MLGLFLHRSWRIVRRPSALMLGTMTLLLSAFFLALTVRAALAQSIASTLPIEIGRCGLVAAVRRDVAPFLERGDAIAVHWCTGSTPGVGMLWGS